ncbi:Uncharacterized membrane-anchored protein YitT, contains DUF161 and DUF2179 domains [Lachnospiraceae bacterium]|nr:Uncharacterized membrane-anchored protein YitT, contains DUF161 and DUF2179 domains [Lachnospiraceae bacterium]
MKDSEKIVLRDIKRILLCIVAGVIISINLKSFVHAGGLLPGGFSGLTILIQNLAERFLSLELPYGPIYLALNALPIVISFRAIGKKFTLFSCITIVMTSVLTDMIPVQPITYDVLLTSIFGGLINGVAISLCLKADATSGGTDFISIYISEKYGLDAWNYILIFNACVLAVNGALFGWDKALYSIIFQFTTTQAIHGLYKRYWKNTLLIVTDKPKLVTDAIYRLTKHGATDISGIGSYQETPRTVVYSVVSTTDLKKVICEVKQIDPCAFINVIKTDQVEGRFTLPKTD